MATEYTCYRATIPAILIFKKDRIVMSIIEFLILQNIGNWDADGFHFDVNQDVYQGYWVPHAQEEECVHGCYSSALNFAINNNKVQLIHSFEYSSSWDIQHEAREMLRQSGVTTAFYEGLFASLA